MKNSFWLLVVVLSHSVMSDSWPPHGLQPARLLCPWGFSRQEYWSGLPCPPPGGLPNPGGKPRSPALLVDSLLSEPPRKPIWLLKIALKKKRTAIHLSPSHNLILFMDILRHVSTRLFCKLSPIAQHFCCILDASSCSVFQCLFVCPLPTYYFLSTPSQNSSFYCICLLWMISPSTHSNVW